jgi:hypothetical protein
MNRYFPSYGIFPIYSIIPFSYKIWWMDRSLHGQNITRVGVGESEGAWSVHIARTHTF